MNAVRKFALLAICASLVATSASLSFVDPFVSSGGYAKARDIIADCARPFFPAMDVRDRPREGEPDGGLFRLASRVFTPAGSHLAYRYRPASVYDAHYHVYARDDFAAVDNADGVRHDSYEREDIAYASASYASGAGGCERIIIVVDPPQLQVGLRESTVTGNAKFPDLLRGVDVNAPKNYRRAVTVPGRNPRNYRGSAYVRVYVAGEPAAQRTVYIRTDARGLPGRYGTTLGHEHRFTQAPAPSSTIHIQGQGGDQRQELSATTNFDGEVNFWVEPGYLGGPESIIARVRGPGGVGELSAARTVVARHRVFAHFIHAHGLETIPTPDANFPFILTGYNQRHNFNHWIPAAQARELSQVMGAVWRNDRNRADLMANPEHNHQHYMQLNDMSLEYGGNFIIGEHPNCEAHVPGRGHFSHQSGLDFDVSPCYTRGANGTERVYAEGCEFSPHLYVRIDERVLSAHVIGDLGGTILEHRMAEGPNGEPADGIAYHYHIRFPERYMDGDDN